MCGYERAAGFLSTLSLRRATALSATSKTSTRHFYPRSPCGERRKFGFTHTAQELFLSTLSLRRATPSPHRTGARPRYFYPRSPCGERLNPCARLDNKIYLFLSTLSLRRATADAPPVGTDCADFYPRSPCGERLSYILFHFLPYNISIHALLAESDSEDKQLEEVSEYFYPRSPCGERPKISTNDLPALRISIHALLAESDCLACLLGIG